MINRKFHENRYCFLITVWLIFIGTLGCSADARALEENPAKSATKMALIPAGEFLMGSNERNMDRSPAHLIDLKAYFIDLYEVTNRQYEAFILDDGYQTEALWSKAGWEFIQRNGIDRPLGLERNRYNSPDQPVVGVSWYEADAYARWANKRLPTEAEWEKAARGTDGRKYPWGNEIDFSRIGYSMADSSRTLPVGSFPSGVSPYGLHDCAGNVSEWVADRYDRTYYSRSPRKNPIGPKTGDFRVLRGSAWAVFDFRCSVHIALRIHRITEDSVSVFGVHGMQSNS